NAVLEAKGSYLPMAIKNTGLIEATGVRENGDGTVSLTGGEGDILNTGVVAALQRSLDGQKETGGSILMTGKNVTSDPGSMITAAGKDGGGTIKLRAADTTILRGEISVVGASDSAKGGQVQLLGEKVGMFESAKVDASGGAGGGEVLVGGDYLGKNPNVPNAKATVMGSEAKIVADATANGDGGRVILWSDEYTGFYGNISAQGGPYGGNGGFIETSSKINLQAFGSVEVGAKSGLSGQWLLDPDSLNISTAANSLVTGATPFQPNPAGSSATLNVGTLNTALGSGNVVIQTTDGPITILANAAIEWAGSSALTINAGSIFTINSGGSISANFSSTGAVGSISINAGIGAAGGIVNNGSIAIAGIAASAPGLTMVTTTGNVSGTGTYLIGNNKTTTVTATAGSISLSNTGNNFGGTVSLTAGGGNALIAGGSMNFGTSRANGNFTIISSGSVTQTAGPITSTSTPRGLITVTAANDITLTQANNDFGSINLTSTGGGTIRYRDTDGFSVAGLSTTGNVQLIAGAGNNITQTANIGTANDPVGGLALTGGANYYFDSATPYTGSNFVNTLASSGGGQIFFKNGQDLEIGQVDLGNGVTVNGLAAGANDIRLIVNGNVTQSQPITGRHLTVLTVDATGGDITLEDRRNSVTSINLQTLSSLATTGGLLNNLTGASISFASNGGYNVRGLRTATGTGNIGLFTGGTVQQEDGFAQAIITAAATPTILAGQLTALNFGGPPPTTGSGYVQAPLVQITAGSGTGAQAFVTVTNGSVDDPAALIVGGAGYTAPTVQFLNIRADGQINGENLTLTGGGNYDLQRTTAGDVSINSVRNIGMDVGGSSTVEYRNFGRVTIGSTSANGISANGITSSGNSANIVLTAGGIIDQTAAIDLQTDGTNAGGGSFSAITRGAAATVTVGNFVALAGAEIDLQNGGNQVGNIRLKTLDSTGTAAALGLIRYVDTDSFNIGVIPPGAAAVDPYGIQTQYNVTLTSGAGADGEVKRPVTQTAAIQIGVKQPTRAIIEGFGGLLLLGQRGYELLDAANSTLVITDPTPLGNSIDFLSANV
ncbi:MAG: hypothetical protein EBZ78_08770, partial [Verrucomicrobia bacterium]|nr:hypothetical protein [Verrucomicrobiota bacterium]